MTYIPSLIQNQFEIILYFTRHPQFLDVEWGKLLSTPKVQWRCFLSFYMKYHYKFNY